MTTQPPMTRAEIEAARERLDEEMSFGKMLHAVGSLPRALDTLEQALEVLDYYANTLDWIAVQASGSSAGSPPILRDGGSRAREFLWQVGGVPDGH